MNKVELVGRLTKDPEIRLTQSQTQFCGFTLAVDRRFKDSNGERQADFINCIAWKERAVFIQKYFHKGSRIGICGSIQTRSYQDNDGKTVFVTEVLVDEAEFVESASKPSEPTTTVAPEYPSNAPEGGQDAPAELPFEI